ncbi:MAG: Uma2 family endonuclease, partial [Phycisphaerales bacterium JB039]
MSALPRQPGHQGYAGLRMTADEYLALGETTDRYQLIDGVVMMSPSPSPAHQRLLAEILYQFESFARAGGDILIFPDTDVRLDDQLVYRPDISIYRTQRLPRIPDRLRLAPDLVVEILSPGSGPGRSRDRRPSTRRRRSGRRRRVWSDRKS